MTIHKLGTELEDFRFNTSIASLMELINDLRKDISSIRPDLLTYVLERFAILISSMAPHLGEECWSLLGNESSIFSSKESMWFDFDPRAIALRTTTIAIQVSGKLRATIEVPTDSEQNEVKAIISDDPRITKFISGKTIVKEIFVKNKIYNIVVK